MLNNLIDSYQKGGILIEKGFDPEAVNAHYQKTGSVTGFKGADAISNEELLELDCDVLLPCALEGQITEANASRIKGCAPSRSHAFSALRNPPS